MDQCTTFKMSPREEEDHFPQKTHPQGHPGAVWDSAARLAVTFAALAHGGRRHSRPSKLWLRPHTGKTSKKKKSFVCTEHAQVFPKTIQGGRGGVGLHCTRSYSNLGTFKVAT
jgi:hypothetical protein